MRMGVSLAKGGNVSLTKQAPGLSAVLVGLGWDERTTSGQDFDLDASALMLAAAGRILSDSHFVFFNNLTSPDGSVEHTGDNLTGEGEGDDEPIKVDLRRGAGRGRPDRVPGVDPRGRDPRAELRPGPQRLHPGGQPGRRRELARYDLSEDASSETAMIFGELYRHGGEWKFRAVGQGYACGLAGIARDYGVNVG